MKKSFKSILAIMAMFAVVATGCKDEETTDPKVDDAITLPSSFTKKVLIEEFTGAWCGWCVDGHLKVDNMMAANGSKIVPVMVHSGDGMQPAEYNSYYKPTFSVTGFPTGMINRVPGADTKVVQSRNVWEAMAATEMAKQAGLGLRIDASGTSGDNATVKVTVGFLEDVTAGCNLVIAILEDKVTGTGSQFDQKNFYANNSNYSSHPFFSRPATILGYEHKFVLRKIVSSAPAGEVIPADKTKKGSIYTAADLSANLSTYNKANCYIAAWVHTPGGAVLNCQIAKVGENKSWD
ncbi:MAG: Omp28-related outer membrane protein [Bacteroidota bacterium]|jgi:hypothetical protein